MIKRNGMMGARGMRAGALAALLGWCALMCLPQSAAQAATLEGQQFDDTVVLANQTLKLNGLGLRGVAWIKAFVAGLYVSTPSQDAAKIMAAAGPKRMRLKIMLQAPSHELTKSLVRRIQRHGTPETQARLEPRLSKLATQLDSVGELNVGDELDMDFLPGKGLVLSHNGKAVGSTIPGEDLYRAVLQIFVGEQAIDPRMKQGLLRGAV